MGASDFTGMRKVTIRDTSTGSTGTFVVMNPEKIGSDGFTASLETNELTTSSFAGDTVEANGTNINATTVSLLPKDIGDLAAIWPNGYDAATGSWQPPIGGCVLNDVTFAFERVCDTKGNIVLRHAQIGLGAEFAFTRDDSLTIEVSVYPTLSPGSEYGLDGDLEDQMIPYQMYNGTYDPATDVVTFDPEES
jgi:hypothetical protein